MGVFISRHEHKGDIMKFDRIDETKLAGALTAFRRELHKYPENAWTEYRTTVRLIQELEKLGIPYWYGKQIHTKGQRVNLQTENYDRDCICRAVGETGEETLIQEMAGGYTGVIAFIDGALPGPVTAVRCDIDCNEVQEDESADRRAVQEGYVSVHQGLMHACGHDTHAAMGLGAAALLCAYRDRLKGRVMLVFQPAEEGGRGALSLVGGHMFDDVDYFFALHGGAVGEPVGSVFASAKGLSVGYKVNFYFRGKAAHAGNSPQSGNNALLAACNAATNLYAIPRHSKGWSRVNVGVMHAGTGRNVIPDQAELLAEVRGETDEIRDFMFERALSVCRGAAEMQRCEFMYDVKVRTSSVTCDPEMIDIVKAAASHMEETISVTDAVDFRGGGDDAAHIIRDVQSRGGKGTYIKIGSGSTVPLHSSTFEVDETVLVYGARLISEVIFEIGDRTGGKKTSDGKEGNE